LHQYGFPKAKKLMDQYRGEIPEPAKLTAEQKLIFEAAFLYEVKKQQETAAARENRHSTPASDQEHV